MNDATVVLRWMGAKIGACVGGYGPVAGTASDAADQLLRYKPVRIPARWEPTVRCVLAWRDGGGGEALDKG